ncbi:hypothetical protein ACWDRB_54865 [Nonomuraea sp. NPDC003707]
MKSSAAQCRRWRIEEDFQAAKGLTGLDAGQVTTWASWHRWSLISMIAHVLPAVVTGLERSPLAAVSWPNSYAGAPTPACAISLTSITSCTGRDGGVATSTAQLPATANGTRQQPRSHE